MLGIGSSWCRLATLASDPEGSGKRKGRSMKVAQLVITSGIVAGLTLIAMPQVAQAQQSGLELRAGLVISPGYRDTLDLAYPEYEITGGFGWLDLGLGYRVVLADGFSIVPGADIMLNFITGASDDGMNTIILPSVNAKYQFGTDSGFYVQAGINFAIVNMGTDRLDEIDSDGVGFQVMAGYQTASSLFLEAGYVNIPVAVDGFDWDEDFGGVSLKMGFGF